MRKKLLGAALPLSLFAALCAAGPAYSTHGSANVTYEVNRGATLVAGPFTTQDSCSSTFCNFNLGLPNREYGRFVRWCGSTHDVIIPANTENTSAFCFGGGQWVFSLGVALRTADGSQSATDANPVTVRIIPFKQ
jgi:hypothetical protein